VTEVKVGIIAGFFDEFSKYQEICLAQEIVAQGHDVTVFCSNQVDYIFPDRVLTKLQRSRYYPVGEQWLDGLRVVRFRPFLSKRAMVLCRHIRLAMREYSPDLLICLKPGQILSVAAAFTSFPQRTRVITVFDDNRAQYAGLDAVTSIIKRCAFYLTKGLLYSLLCRRSNRVFTNTPNGRRIIGPLAFGKEVDVLPLSFDPKIYSPDTLARRRTRAEIGIADEAPVLITTGKAIAKKELERLISALSLLPDPTARLIIIGTSEGAYKQFLERFAQEKGVAQRVHLIDFLPPERVASYLNAADIGIWHKQPAISIQQAMGTGLFCVLPKNDLVGHLLTPKTGDYFRDGDYAHLQECLLRLCSRSALEFESGRQERARENARFSQAMIAKLLLKKAMER
jgi:glycosyltransferase involved in cell wall biosynthesis